MYSLMIYILLLFCSLFLFRLAKNENNEHFRMLIFIAVSYFALFVGLRWDVGEDYLSYYQLLIGDFEYDILVRRLEFFPRILLKLCLYTSIPFYYWFIVMAFLQIYFIQKALRNITITILCWGIFFFITMRLQEQMNIVRQGVALCVVVYAYTFIHKKKPLIYVLLILLASLFHKSAIFCLPLYIIGQYNISFPIAVQLAVFIGMSVSSTMLIAYFTDKLSSIAVSIGYGNALDVLQNNSLLTKAGSGLGIVFNYYRYLVLIYYSPKLTDEYSKNGFNVFYTISFIFMCFYSACFYSIYLQRVFIYFAYSEIVVFAFLSMYLFKKRHDFIPLMLFLSLTIGQIVLYLVSASPWQFIWDSNRIINFN